MMSEISWDMNQQPTRKRQEGETWEDRPLYWSTIAYLRWWWAADGVRVSLIAESGLTAPLLRKIAIDYRVNRGIPARGEEEDVAAQGLCELLNRVRSKWPAGLVERARFCESLLKCEAKPFVHGQQASLLTKLMWFLCPDGWTPFDNLAATGAGIATTKTCKRMTDFYSNLHDAGFSGSTAEMQKVVNASPLKGFPATRIVDNLLMTRGEKKDDSQRTANARHFLKLLPPDTRETVDNVAAKLQQQFGKEPLFAPRLGLKN